MIVFLVGWLERIREMIFFFFELLRYYEKVLYGFFEVLFGWFVLKYSLFLGSFERKIEIISLGFIWCYFYLIIVYD